MEGRPLGTLEASAQQLVTPWTVLPFLSSGPCLGCAPPRSQWARARDDSTSPCSGLQLPASLLPLSPGLHLPSECLPWAHRRGKRGPLGLGRGTNHGEDRGPESRLLGLGSLGTESQALGSPLPQVLSPLPAAGAGSELCYGDHTPRGQFPAVRHVRVHVT